MQHNKHYAGDGPDVETGRKGLHKGFTVFDGPTSTSG